jgi:hypothetical protein
MASPADAGNGLASHHIIPSYSPSFASGSPIAWAAIPHPHPARKHEPLGFCGRDAESGVGRSIELIRLSYDFSYDFSCRQRGGERHLVAMTATASIPRPACTTRREGHYAAEA